MKLSELNLPPTRREEIKEICKIFNAQTCSIIDHTFAETGRRKPVWNTGNQEPKQN